MASRIRAVMDVIGYVMLIGQWETMGTMKMEAEMKLEDEGNVLRVFVGIEKVASSELDALRAGS